MTTTPVPVEVPAMETPKFELRIADRCDRCGAQAYVAVDCGDTELLPLLFCAHHFAKHEDQFAYWRVLVDKRQELIEEERG